MMHVIVLGATGSVGETTAQVLRQHRDRYQVEGLVARQNGRRLLELAAEFNPAWIGLTTEEAGAQLLPHQSHSDFKVLVGMPAILSAISDAPPSRVIGAMSGFAGLLPTLTAIDQGFDILLANKETMVAAGDLVRERAKRSGSRLIPVDSEHSAIFQCLALDQPFSRIVLTCSGGPFRGKTRADLEQVTVEAALKHPNWSMGPKITVDSATLMNKGLELIEAHQLFAADYDQLDVVIHPQSIIHSMVEFVDGATMAQLGWPDMRVPVQVALSWPERWPLSVAPMDWSGRQLTFESPDEETFPALSLARAVGKAGGLLPAVFNAANEVAVAGFLDSRIRFLGIMEVVEAVVQRFRDNGRVRDLEQILEADRWARKAADGLVNQS
ncbi:MAG: 1-deoxy-D-xylulose-5-phosphate reductoisomerase [Firmicutes bacterium]|nr:1-deoxy-D-xylulose-5-phosphate reductoisomerase [Bacillota bacterium]MCL5971851.1 1-deoxy-D-xylulose-5-phosphate reductoisomerase [Bacillota bacterium]